MSSEIILNGKPYVLKWGRAALVRADALGVFTDEKSGGIAQTAKQAWAMLPDAARRIFPDYVALFEAMPPLEQVKQAIVSAMNAAENDENLKNVFGSTSGPSQSSS